MTEPTAYEDRRDAALPATHTPGPWRVARRSDTNGRETHGIVVNASLLDVASLDYTFAREDADACLIAAAPELLEACRAALEFSTARKQPEPLSTMVHRLEAAIAKAEGRI